MRDAMNIVVCSSGTGDFTTISAALAAARPDGRILVLEGTYVEQIVLTRPVVIEGPEQGTATVEVQGSPCLRMVTDRARISGIAFRCGSHDVDEDVAAVYHMQGNLTLQHCDIYSPAGTGIMSVGAGAKLALRNCRVRDCAQHGVVLIDCAELVAEHCAFERNAWSDLTLRAATAMVSDCTFRDCANVSVHFTNQSHGVLQRSVLARAARAAIIIADRSDPPVRACILRDGTDRGVSIQEGGKGTIEDCTIANNGGTGITHGGASDPTIRRCRIHENGCYGIQMYDGARPVVEDCEIRGSAQANIWITDGADPLIRRCTVQAGKAHGFWIERSGHGLVEDCAISEHGEEGISLLSNSDTEFRRCSIRGNQGPGALLAGGTLKDCIVYGNGSYAAVILCGGASSLQGCTITAADTTSAAGSYGYAVLIHGVETHVTLETCDLRADQGHALRAGAVGQVALRECHLASSRGPALLAFQSNVTMERCNIVTDSGAAIAGVEEAEVTLSDCIVTGGQNGLLLDGRSRATVLKSTLTGTTGACVHVGELSRVSLIGSTMAVQLGCGINTRGAGQCVAEQCTIEVTRGLWIRNNHGGQVHLTACSLRGLGVGMLTGRHAKTEFLDCTLVAQQQIVVRVDDWGEMTMNECTALYDAVPDVVFRGQGRCHVDGSLVRGMSSSR